MSFNHAPKINTFSSKILKSAMLMHIYSLLKIPSNIDAALSTNTHYLKQVLIVQNHIVFYQDYQVVFLPN